MKLDSLLDVICRQEKICIYDNKNLGYQGEICKMPDEIYEKFNGRTVNEISVNLGYLDITLEDE